MQEAYSVRGVQRFGDLVDDANGMSRLLRSVCEDMVQVAACYQTHTDEEAAVYFAVVIDWDYMWSIEACRRVSLSPESVLKVIVIRQMGS